MLSLRRAALKALTVRELTNWATVAPEKISGDNPVTVSNFVSGEWRTSQSFIDLPDPLRGDAFIRCPDTTLEEAQPFVTNMQNVPKSGLHNPLKQPERYLMYGEITAKLCQEMRKPEVKEFFTRLIQRVAPKSYDQALGEVDIATTFLENFCGDQVRFLARGFSVPGDRLGQESMGYRWPYGAVAVITPFNFPFEIPVLQLMGALYMGNRPTLHVDHRVSSVIEQFLRLLIHCGMPTDDLDFLNGRGSVINQVLIKGMPRSTLFTGSKRVADKLSSDLKGKVYLEDAGFDWKILGPDVADLSYIAWVCDQDAYAYSGQKCSAQSILFIHENWNKAGLEEKLRQRASRRKLDDFTVGPVLTWTTASMLHHIEQLLSIPGARLAFGGKELTNHSIPDCYGALEPTAVFVPLNALLSEQHFHLVTTEVFGPVQILTEYKANELDLVLEACNRLDAHLSAAVVSRDVSFLNKVLGNTVNGTTYAGIRARTTGAPQNHWFGPGGDPRGAGIGTPEAIRLVWSCHREIIRDEGDLPDAAVIDALSPT